jgi:hypothetical protein
MVYGAKVILCNAVIEEYKTRGRVRVRTSRIEDQNVAGFRTAKADPNLVIKLNVEFSERILCSYPVPVSYTPNVVENAFPSGAVPLNPEDSFSSIFPFALDTTLSLQNGSSPA